MSFITLRSTPAGLNKQKQPIRSFRKAAKGIVDKWNCYMYTEHAHTLYSSGEGVGPGFLSVMYI